jgi:hypothetical protein
MVRSSFLIALCLVIAVSINAQKVHRAAKALTELKFEKAIDLFGDVLKKDSNNVSALIGFAKAHWSENSVNKTNKTIELLEDCSNYLTRAKIEYAYIEDEEKKFLVNELYIYGESSIDNLKKQISYLIWRDFINNEKSIAKFERFKELYYTVDDNHPERVVNDKLDKLYYDSVTKVNTVDAYNFYINKFSKGIFINDAKSSIVILEYNAAFNAKGVDKLIVFSKKFPNNKYANLAKKEIEKREFDRAFADPSVELLENYIRTYPKAEQITRAMAEVVSRDYKTAKSSQLLKDYETFLQKH